MPGVEENSPEGDTPQGRVVKKVKKVKKTVAQPLPEPPAPPALPETAPAPLPLPPPPPVQVQADVPAVLPPARAPTMFADERPSAESRISSIDIDKLTDELEKDILSSLHSEMGDLLASQPPATTKQKAPVQSVPPAAAQSPSPHKPAPPAPARPPESVAQTRAMESEQRERRVAHRLGREFDKLPVNMRNELIKTLARTDDVKVREDVVIATASNFDKLPPEVRALLKTLATDQDSRVREEVAFELNRNFAKISPDFRNELLPLLARDVDIKVREDVVAAIASHYDEHPPSVQELLKVLAADKNASVRQQVASEMMNNADRIPENLRTDLTRQMENAESEDSRGKR